MASKGGGGAAGGGRLKKTADKDLVTAIGSLKSTLASLSKAKSSPIGDALKDSTRGSLGAAIKELKARTKVANLGQKGNFAAKNSRAPGQDSINMEAVSARNADLRRR